MIAEELEIKGKLAKEASYFLSTLNADKKNAILKKMAESLLANKDKIILENKKDLANAEKNNISEALKDRLALDEKRISDMAEGLLELIKLEDPIGEVERMWQTVDGLEIGKMRVPLGVVGIIYEARPNVTVDAAGLCLKSGNAVILRGGSDAIYSNLAILDVLETSFEEMSLPKGLVQIIENTDREIANQMLKLNQYLDVLIPRGGAGLIKNVVENATVPVIETGVGNCHIYVDDTADLENAIEIIINAKTQRPGVCNALESLLVNEKIADDFLPNLYSFLKAKGVEVRCCKKSFEILGQEEVKLAKREDYQDEFLDLILAIKVVSNIHEAIDHIREFGSGHSEAILTNNYKRARFFQKNIDAAAVYVNASTRFTDGFQFGFGAEIGISTQKLHARGPMGLNELTSYKYIINGQGQTRK